MPSSFDRRELLRIGGVSILGSVIGSPSIAMTKETTARANSCIFLMLQGGPSHLDLWDPKPKAPVEVRGAFGTVPTSITGERFGELLPLTAKLADRLSIVRSMSHKFTNHIAGTYITMTGSDNQQDRDREAHVDDFPGPGAILNQLNPARGVPRSVSLPNWLSIPGPSNRMPGQYGGFLGSVHDPFVIEGDPSSKDYNPLSLKLTQGMSSDRMSSRIELKSKLDGLQRTLEAKLRERYDRYLEGAYALVADGRVRKALDLTKESNKTRERYGRNKVGQSLLLARRLVEAGVTMVSYNAFNQKWDTHGNLVPRYRQIVPPVDQAYSALIEDLEGRQMLDSTLVIHAGEFGRTPTMNKDAGRDHWPNVYSTVMCGGGIQRGAIVGKSDWKGGEVADRPVSPGDILATMWHLMGISPETQINDRLDRPFPIADGNVVHELIA